MSKELSGVLFKNDKREADTHPHYKGSCMIAGVEFWLSAWINEGEKGKYMALKFKVKETQAPRPAEPPKAKAPADDSDIPW